MANDDLFYKLGQMFKLGLGTDSDVTKAIEYFRCSAEMNNKNGLFEYGKALLTGEHIPQDTDSAVKLLEKAVKLKNRNAKRFLALEYISGEHLEQDIEKGIALLTECADSGDVIACYRLGKIYLQGEIMPQNLDKAERYLLLAESIFSVQRDLQRIRNKLSNGLQSPQMMETSMLKICLRIWSGMKTLCLPIRSLVCLQILVGA